MSEFNGTSIPQTEDRTDELLRKIALILSNGSKGGVVIADTATRISSAGYSSIQALTDIVLHADTQGNLSGIAGVTIPAGSIIFGLFTVLKFTSGTGVAYAR